jgi:phosphotransferase system enzyme I (PtsP)
MRPGQVLELYATEGLKKRAAVHKSKLKVGEGLVASSTSRRLASIWPTQNHPSFKYLPETGKKFTIPFWALPSCEAAR